MLDDSKSYINDRYNLQDIIEYVFVILTIFNSVSVYYYSFSITHYVIDISWQVILFIIFINSLRKSSNDRFLKSITFALIFIPVVLVILLLLYTIYPFSLIKYISILAFDPAMLVSYFLSKNNNSCKLAKGIFFKYERVMIILSIISLIFWIIYVLHIFSPNISLVLHGVASGQASATGIGASTDPGYFYLDFISQGSINFLGIDNFVRNTGIFTEAPAYSYMLCIALFVELFIKKNNDECNYQIVILLITILTTTSTNGIMIAIPAYLYYLFLINNNKYIRIFVIILIPILLIFFKFAIATKAGDVNNLYSSYNIRMNDISSAFKAWKDHLIIGNGIGNNSSVAQYMYGFRMALGDTSSSSGILSILAYGGIIYALYYVIPIVLSMTYSLKMFGVTILTFSLLIFVVAGVYFSYIILLSYFWSCVLIKFDKI